MNKWLCVLRLIIGFECVLTIKSTVCVATKRQLVSLTQRSFRHSENLCCRMRHHVVAGKSRSACALGRFPQQSETFDAAIAPWTLPNGRRMTTRRRPLHGMRASSFPGKIPQTTAQAMTFHERPRVGSKDFCVDDTMPRTIESINDSQATPPISVVHASPADDHAVPNTGLRSCQPVILGCGKNCSADEHQGRCLRGGCCML